MGYGKPIANRSSIYLFGDMFLNIYFLLLGIDVTCIPYIIKIHGVDYQDKANIMVAVLPYNKFTL